MCGHLCGRQYGIDDGLCWYQVTGTIVVDIAGRPAGNLAVVVQHDVMQESSIDRSDICVRIYFLLYSAIPIISKTFDGLICIEDKDTFVVTDELNIFDRDIDFGVKNNMLFGIFVKHMYAVVGFDNSAVIRILVNICKALS